MFLKKPLGVIQWEMDKEVLPRQLSLFDLMCIGISGTVGTGIFATADDIIRGMAGPSAAISWLIAGMACCLSGLAYMEMSSRVPSSGSCYAYAYHALGELPAVVAAWLLTLEYGVSGAGVARSWAEKVQLWAQDLHPDSDYKWLNDEHWNFMACLIQLLCVGILLAGFKFGKVFVNIATICKVSLVLFMIIGGFALADQEHFDPFLPPRTDDGRYGVQGMMLGASSAFFGYVGFDEVCCLAAEAKDPRRTLPRAVLGVIFGTCLLSTLAFLALSGMIPYEQIDRGFGGAFGDRGLQWAKHLVEFGEIITMPVVVLIAFLAQPRLQYGLAVDGLLPSLFAKTDNQGNLFWNTLITGVIFAKVALKVPFDDLLHLVDFGVLMSFSITNSALIASRDFSREKLVSWIGAYIIASGASIVSFQKGYIDCDKGEWLSYSIAMALAAVGCCGYMAYLLRHSIVPSGVFTVPLVPWIPCLAIAVNWYLIAQINYYSLLYGLCWIAFGVVLYIVYGFRHSVGQQTQWEQVLSLYVEERS